MAIVKTTASGGNVPEKNNPSNTTSARPNPRAGGGVGVRQAQPTDRKAFVQDTIAELKRVVWPTREQVRSGVIVTIGLLVFFSLYIFGLDRLFSAIFTALGLYPKS